MPVIDTAIPEFIASALLQEDQERENNHTSSGKLSASMLYQPLRFQVLKTIGAPRKPMDAYTLGKFQRGREVEDAFVARLGEDWIDKDGVKRKGMNVLVERQKMIEYRGCIGFADAIVDSDKLLEKRGIMPHEVKSVTNMKLKRIAATEVDYHYKMQACYYALGMGSECYAVDIVSAEDLRPSVYVFETHFMKDEVEKAITAYQIAMGNWEERKILPPFEANPNVPWTKDIKYAMFDEFYVTAPDSIVINKLKELGLCN